MATTQNQNSNSTEQPVTYGNASFEVPGYDTSKIEPDAWEAPYEAKFHKCSWQFTNKQPPRPMIRLEWKLVGSEVEEEQIQKCVGRRVTDWIIISNDREGNGGKAKLRTLQETLELDIDFSRMNPDTVTALGEALRGRTIPLWITNREEADGNIRTNVHYRDPNGGASMLTPMMSAPTDEEPTEEEPAVEEEKPKKAAPAKSRR